MYENTQKKNFDQLSGVRNTWNLVEIHNKGGQIGATSYKNEPLRNLIIWKKFNGTWVNGRI